MDTCEARSKLNVTAADTTRGQSLRTNDLRDTVLLLVSVVHGFECSPLPAFGPEDLDLEKAPFTGNGSLLLGGAELEVSLLDTLSLQNHAMLGVVPPVIRLIEGVFREALVGAFETGPPGDDTTTVDGQDEVHMVLKWLINPPFKAKSCI